MLSLLVLSAIIIKKIQEYTKHNKFNEILKAHWLIIITKSQPSRAVESRRKNLSDPTETWSALCQAINWMSEQLSPFCQLEGWNKNNGKSCSGSLHVDVGSSDRTRNRRNILTRFLKFLKVHTAYLFIKHAEF